MEKTLSSSSVVCVMSCITHNMLKDNMVKEQWGGAGIPRSPGAWLVVRVNAQLDFRTAQWIHCISLTKTSVHIIVLS